MSSVYWSAASLQFPVSAAAEIMPRRNWAVRVLFSAAPRLEFFMPASSALKKDSSPA